MDLFVPLMALAYLLLQLTALFWIGTAWQRLARVPLWVFGAGTVLLVAVGTFGSPLSAILMIVSLPLATGYLAFVWVLYLTVGPRSVAPL